MSKTPRDPMGKHADAVKADVQIALRMARARDMSGLLPRKPNNYASPLFVREVNTKNVRREMFFHR